VAYGGRPGQDGQQGWTDSNAGWVPPQVPPQWRYGHAQRPAWYGQQGGTRAPGRPGEQGGTQAPGRPGEQEYEERGRQAGAGHRSQPPAWSYRKRRYGRENARREYPPGQPQPQFPPTWPAEKGQQGFGPTSAQPPGRPPQRGKSWLARHKALTGILALVALIVTIGAAYSGEPPAAPGVGTRVGLTATAPTPTKTPSHHATRAAAAAQKTHPVRTQPAAPVTSHAPAPSAPAPTTHAAAVPPPTTAAPTTAAPTTAAATAAAPSSAAPSSAAPASCQPLTNAGNCYEPGEYCRASDHGVTGVAGDGETITCEDNDGWRWEPS
jgi:hypothetical protein